MASLFRVPRLRNPNIVVRVTSDSAEIEQANKLVFRNYVAAGFWENNEDRWRKNKYLHTPARQVIVAMDKHRVLGTMSIIMDSLDGLPSDTAQPVLMRDLRASGGVLAEVSAFAVDRSSSVSSTLCLLLISYGFQYCLYYTEIDRLALSCVSTHADFYESALCFSKVSGLTYYDYTHTVAHLLSLDLKDAHSLLSRRHAADPGRGENFYRFLICEPHTCHRFPPQMRRMGRVGLLKSAA